ncbi:MAG: DUF309 domain-containing protein [Elainellaceae cyanobacterium]
MDHEAPMEFWRGVDQFNQGEFYACHDTLEEIWLTAMEPQKTFYQGILQIAVALYHLTNHNWRGSVTLLGDGLRRLRRYEPDYMDVDVARLVYQSQALLLRLQETEPEAIASLAEAMMHSTDTPIADTPTLQRPTVERLTN